MMSRILRSAALCAVVAAVVVTPTRAIESSADIDGARSAGVDPAKFQKMRERFVTFKESPKAFSGAEMELLSARKGEIADVLKTP
jgi:hypothetical protein